MKVVCPGSYDPITMGHLDIIARSSRMFEEVVVAVVHNPSKSGRFDPEVRADLIRRSLAEDERTQGAQNITIDLVSGGLLVDYCTEVGASVLVVACDVGVVDNFGEHTERFEARRVHGVAGEQGMVGGHVQADGVGGVARGGDDVDLAARGDDRVPGGQALVA